jgi:hypothetical protein
MYIFIDRINVRTAFNDLVFAHSSSQSEPVSMPLAWTFLILSTVLLEWLMLSLFVAVVTGTFERVRETYRGKVQDVY